MGPPQGGTPPDIVLHMGRAGLPRWPLTRTSRPAFWFAAVWGVLALFTSLLIVFDGYSVVHVVFASTAFILALAYAASSIALRRRERP